MDKFLTKFTVKRSTLAEDLNDSTKKAKKEQCSHEKRCYRRNPHHFMEYEHKHLNNFLEAGPSFELPDDFPQPRAIVEEQLAILKSLTMKTNSETDKSSACFDSASAVNSSNKTEVSPSSSSSKSYKKLEKKTNFKPNQEGAVAVTGCMKDKLELASPYNVFFTKIPDAPHTITEENSVTFTDLLCPSLGQLEKSLQINFMIDIMWLMEQYNAQKVGKLPLTILYGYEFPNMEMYMNKCLPNVSYHEVKMKDSFGTHHSKVGIYIYKDKSLRVVVSTANLYYEDWNHYNQGLWISPLCPRLPDGDTEYEHVGPTAFKTSLLNYLKHYNLPILKSWIDHVKMADFDQIKAFLVTSVPGKHYSEGSHLQRVGDLLSRHCVLPQKTTPEAEGPLSWGVMAQASSIGSLGKDAGQWLRKYLLRSLASHQRGQLPGNSPAMLNVIYPSVSNVLSSYYGPDGGGCLPYSKAMNDKQLWLKAYLHQWKADHLRRTRAMPHIKSYCRVSPCLTKLAWFLLTSANLSKSAWGGNIQRDNAVSVRSYEVGVMFLPKFFGTDYFYIRNTDDYNGKTFPFIYDLPLTSYEAADTPWCN